MGFDKLLDEVESLDSETYGEFLTEFSEFLDQQHGFVEDELNDKSEEMGGVPFIEVGDDPQALAGVREWLAYSMVTDVIEDSGSDPEEFADGLRMQRDNLVEPAYQSSPEQDFEEYVSAALEYGLERV